MHVDQYNHYEPKAFQALMGRYVTREREGSTRADGGRAVRRLSFVVVAKGICGRLGATEQRAWSRFTLHSRNAAADANRCLRVMWNTRSRTGGHVTFPKKIERHHRVQQGRLSFERFGSRLARVLRRSIAQRAENGGDLRADA